MSEIWRRRLRLQISGNAEQGRRFPPLAVLMAIPLVLGLVVSASARAQTTNTISRSTAHAASASVYWMVGSDGGVFGFGGAPYEGSLPAIGIHVKNIKGIVPTSDGKGYWLVGSDGGVFSFGDAGFVGSIPGLGIHINNVVGAVPTSDGKGYWMVGSDGGVFAFGDAGFVGSIPGLGTHVGNVVAVVPTHDGGGYWMIGSDGGVFGFGDATYKGSLPGLGIHTGNIIGAVPTADAQGYWMVGSDGGVFSFGDAGFVGSLPGLGIHVSNIVGIVSTADSAGYWMVGSDGGVFGFGDAGFVGSLPGLGIHVNNIVGFAPGATGGPSTAPGGSGGGSGPTWSGAHLLGNGGVNDVFCVSASFCVAIGSDHVWTYRNGQWSVPTFFSGYSLASVSCGSASFCVAVGGSGGRGLSPDALIFDGSSWSSMFDPVLTSRPGQFFDVKCRGTTFCMAVGNSYDPSVTSGPSYTTLAEVFNGVSWTITPTPAQPLPGYVGFGMTHVDCGNAGNCAAVGDAFSGPRGAPFVETYAGNAWTVSPFTIPPAGYSDNLISGISCPSPSWCMTSGLRFVRASGPGIPPPSGWTLTNTGGGWSFASVTPELGPLSCALPDVCQLASYSLSGSGNFGLMIADQGGTWSSPITVDETQSIKSVSCPFSTFCMAVDGSNVFTYK